MKVSALTGTGNYFEDFKVGDVLKHARGKTVEPLEQVWITNVTMNTAEAHFNEHLTKGTNYGQRLGFVSRDTQAGVVDSSDDRNQLARQHGSHPAIGPVPRPPP